MKTFLSGVRLLFYRWPVWVVVFVTNLCFAFIIALPFSQLLNRIAEHSSAPQKGIEYFDIDFIADVLNNYGSELNVWFGQVLFYIVIFLILNIFLSGGVIASYVHLFKGFALGEFLSDCAKHFWRLFRLALYFIGAQVFVVFVLLTIYSKLGLSPFELESDQVLINRTRIMLVALVILFAWIDMVHEYSKVRQVAQKEKSFILPQLIKIKWFALRNFFSMAFLYLLCFATLLIVGWICSMASSLISMGTTTSIIVVVLIGQLLLFFRIGTRLLFTSTTADYLRQRAWAE